MSSPTHRSYAARLRVSPAAIRGAIVLGTVLLGALYGLLGLRRFWTVHNETFDLAFYARLGHGLLRFDFWEPIVGGIVLGMHISPVLIPLGLLGEVFGGPETLLVAQALAIVLATIPIYRIGERHLGVWGGGLAAAVWMLHPNLSHVASFEAHPGTIAVLPLAMLANAVDGRDIKQFKYAAWGVFLCREDLMLSVAVAAGCFYFISDDPSLKKTLRRIIAWSIAYVLLFLQILVPIFGPERGSLEAHFGSWGGSPFGVLRSLFTNAIDTLTQIFAARKITGLALFFAPALFILNLTKRGRSAFYCMLPALPTLALVLISTWPSVGDVKSHYLTPMAPFVTHAAIVSVASVEGSLRRMLAVTVMTTSVALFYLFGQTPLSKSFEREVFEEDAHTLIAKRVLAQIPPRVGVQAPDPLLPHLSNRLRPARTPPPEEATHRFVIFDISYRDEYANQGHLLRTVQEPNVRTWLAKQDHALVAYDHPYIVLEKGIAARNVLLPKYRAPISFAGVTPGQKITPCLSVHHAAAMEGGYRILFRAHGRCPADLGLRVGVTRKPKRIDLLFDGLLSPAHLRDGDYLWSFHPQLQIDPKTETLNVGLVRQSESMPEKTDPVSVVIPIKRAGT